MTRKRPPLRIEDILNSIDGKTATNANLTALKEVVKGLQDDEETIQDIINNIQLVTGAVMDEGTSTSGTETSLTDTDRNWEEDIWVGSYVRVEDDTGTVHIREITSNTSDTLNWDSNMFDVDINDYDIRQRLESVVETGVRDRLDTLINAIVEEESE